MAAIFENVGYFELFFLVFKRQMDNDGFAILYKFIFNYLVLNFLKNDWLMETKRLRRKYKARVNRIF